MTEGLPNREAATALFDTLNTALVQYCEMTGDKNGDDPVAAMLEETIVKLGLLLYPDFTEASVSASAESANEEVFAT